ncbi:hypothetical protein [Alicyclobacillus sp.]|uniref:hypothetical protein n=1 Tax=Alicyclobacillus sp. TaxID=61169 RepID=UPI0025C2B5D7|nr:hypothetical protein [Alicyclobacillus sp.]MCL6515803.1 hypothetical protein [Alicyclobacillus sp.]
MDVDNRIEFHIGGWKVGTIGQSSGVFSGENLQYGWRSASKSNSALGKVTGDGNLVQAHSETVIDPDQLDTWVQKMTPVHEWMPASPALLRLLAQRRRTYRRAAMGPADGGRGWP